MIHTKSGIQYLLLFDNHESACEASDIIVRFIEIERVPMFKKTIDSHTANEILFFNPNNTVVEYFQANL